MFGEQYFKKHKLLYVEFHPQTTKLVYISIPHTIMSLDVGNIKHTCENRHRLAQLCILLHHVCEHTTCTCFWNTLKNYNATFNCASACDIAGFLHPALQHFILIRVCFPTPNRWQHCTHQVAALCLSSSATWHTYHRVQRLPFLNATNPTTEYI